MLFFFLLIYLCLDLLLNCLTFLFYFIFLLLFVIIIIIYYTLLFFWDSSVVHCCVECLGRKVINLPKSWVVQTSCPQVDDGGDVCLGAPLISYTPLFLLLKSHFICCIINLFCRFIPPSPNHTILPPLYYTICKTSTMM